MAEATIIPYKEHMTKEEAIMILSGIRSGFLADKNNDGYCDDNIEALGMGIKALKNDVDVTYNKRNPKDCDDGIKE